MCGISGIYTRSSSSLPLRAQLEPLTRCLLHRGPDAIGYWQDTHVAFGHTRLAIIDLSSAANQPFVDAELGLAMTYNGEIYNYREIRTELEARGYRFRTVSDTEVLLKAFHCWRYEAFARFVGMWAIAIYDSIRKEMVLCRDRFGIKPLYYVNTKDGLAFSSEIRGLLPYTGNRSGNRTEISRFLATGLTDTGSDTFFDEICRVPAASYCTITLSKVNQIPEFRSYWSAGSFVVPSGDAPSYRTAADQLKTLLTDAVSLHLRSDVPIGMCVSGGTDSSIIAGVCASILGSHGTIPHAFAAIFPGSWFDESAYVKSVVSKWDLQATYVSPTPSDFEREIDDVVRCQTEPFGSTGVYLQWKLFQAIASEGIKVVLDGQGADEYFAGYLPFLISFALSGNLATRAGRLVSNLLPVAVANFGTLRHRFGSPLTFLRAVSRSGGRVGDTDLLSPSALEVAFHLRHQNGSDELETIATPLKRELLRYITTYSLPAILRFEDRNSMAFSIESRVPYLDHRLMEFVLSLPDDYLIRRGQTKAILRDAGRDFLPDSVANRKVKLGFATPQHEWTREVLMPRIRESLEEPALRDVINVGAVSRALSKAMAADDNTPVSEFWWRLYNVARWHDILSVN